MFIEGSIPLSIGNLTRLETLHLVLGSLTYVDTNTTMRTSLPSTMGHLTQLRELRLELLYLDGLWPATLNNLFFISELSISSASPLYDLSISGKFAPSFWYQTSSLKILKIHHTNLGGFDNGIDDVISAPIERLSLFDNPYFAMQVDTFLFFTPTATQVFIADCPGVKGELRLPFNHIPLKELVLSSASLYGNISDLWQNVPSLEVVLIRAPLISGSISSAIGMLENVSSIYIASPLISGPIPPEIGACSRLETLFMYGPISGPIPSEMGALSLLQTFEIHNASLLGTLPASLANLSMLQDFVIYYSGLLGTIPQSFSNLNFSILNLAANQLKGQLPPLRCQQCLLSFNQFSGTIPPSLGRYASTLHLQHNHLGPRIASDTFIGDERVSSIDLDLSDNKFRDLLPELFPNDGSHENVAVVKVTSNRFHGSIPDSWSSYSVEADANLLDGDLNRFFSIFRGTLLSLRHNQFSGTVPPLNTMTSLVELHLDGNQLRGRLPPVGPALTIFTASNNHFADSISPDFITSVKAGNLVTLDLSWNQLSCPDQPELFLSSLLQSQLVTLSLSQNAFDCYFTPQRQALDDIPTNKSQTRSADSPLRSLDLSHNNFKGSLIWPSLPSLVILDLSANKFSGSFLLTQPQFPVIAQIDISHNLFTTDVSTIGNLPFLFSLSARGNHLSGTLSLLKMPKLEYLDYSENLLDGPIDLDSISKHVAFHSLRAIYITYNPRLPTISPREVVGSYLNRTSLSSPSPYHPGVICYSLTFYRLKTLVFEFDEGLFNYSQCNCDSTHFGLPPSQCSPCPASNGTAPLYGVSKCGGTECIVSRNTFVLVPEYPWWSSPEYFIPPPSASKSYTILDEFASSVIQLISWPNLGAGSIIPADSSRQQDSSITFQTESCLVLPEQSLTRTSNCKGLNITADRISNLTNLPEFLASQCEEGAAGRLCSQCICNWLHESQPLCYFEKALTCHKCSFLLTAPQFLGILFGGVGLLMVIGVIMMLTVLRSKRVQKTTSWKRLPLIKRIFYRILYLTSLGNVSILVTFAQIFIELTHWDAYVIGGIVKLTNLQGEGLGLRCIFPFLSDPISNLLVKLFAPILVVLAATACIGLAELASKLLTRIASGRAAIYSRGRYSYSVDNSTIPNVGLADATIASSEEEDATNFVPEKSPLLGASNHEWFKMEHTEESERREVEYPSGALVSTVAITITKFFYFGSALSAHEYLFSSRDPNTGLYYLQNLPYVLVNDGDASIPRWISLPFILIFDLILPVAFIILCIALRKKLTKAEKSPYVGTLFDNYTTQCYWWEIMIIFKKLSIALVLRGIPASDILQVTLILSIIAGILVLQTSLNPWRRKVENVMDALGSAILIGALLAARSGGFQNSLVSVYYVLAVGIAFAVASLIIILVQTWYGTTDYEKRALLSSAITTESEAEDEDSSSLHTINGNAKRNTMLPNPVPAPHDSHEGLS